MARADSLSKQDRASLLVEKPSPIWQVTRILLLGSAAILIFTVGLTVAVLATR